MTEQSNEPHGSDLPQPYSAPGALAPRQLQIPQVQPLDDSLQLAAYLQIFVRRKWLLVAVASTVLVLALLQVFTTTPLYRSRVTLQVDPEDAKVLPYEEIAQSGGSLTKTEYLWTQAEKLKTRGLAGRVIDKLQLGELPAFNAPTSQGMLLDARGKLLGTLRWLIGGGSSGSGDVDAAVQQDLLVNRLLGEMTVRPLRNTRLIEVGYQSHDPQLAADISNTLAEEFIEQHLESKFEATTRATDFLDKQLDELKIKVEESEEALVKYAQAKNIVNLNERETINRKKLADLSDELTRAESDLILKTTRYEAANAASISAFPEALKNSQIRSLEERLAQNERDLAGLSSRYGEQWPAVKELRRQIEEAKSQLAAQKRQALGAAASEYRLARERRDKLQAALAQQRQIVDRLNEDSIQYRYLKRDTDSNKELYDGLLQRLKEAGVAAGLKSSNIRIADRAVVPRAASSPRKGRSMVLALVLGLLLGTVAIFLAEMLDNTIKSTEEVVHQLGLPALGIIPSLANQGSRGGKLIPWRSKPSDVRSPVLASSGQDAMHGRAWEAYRSLRTSLLLSHSGKPPQVILVTSALPGEGKTTTVANTAMAMAQTGARTLVIDLDMRRPALSKTFGITTNGGMSAYLSGNSDLSSLIQRTTIPELYLLSAGPPAPNPPELLGSARMAKGLELAREYFTHVVIDSPPTLELSDALVLSRAVDGVILVARAGKTPRQALHRASDRLIKLGAQILGVLINDVDVERGEYSYYYGGYYQGYDSYFSKNAPDFGLDGDERKTA
ncbi:MAG: polysaccharide biosynthesis tyrosine autokinase [Acidobacteriota bacterium]